MTKSVVSFSQAYFFRRHFHSCVRNQDSIFIPFSWCQNPEKNHRQNMSFSTTVQPVMCAEIDNMGLFCIGVFFHESIKARFTSCNSWFVNRMMFSHILVIHEKRFNFHCVLHMFLTIDAINNMCCSFIFMGNGEITRQTSYLVLHFNFPLKKPSLIFHELQRGKIVCLRRFGCCSYIQMHDKKKSKRSI